jgi:hypothetical protein
VYATLARLSTRITLAKRECCRVVRIMSPTVLPRRYGARTIANAQWQFFFAQLRPPGATSSASAFRVVQYSVVLPNFPTETIKESKAQIERPQSARDAPCHIPMATQIGSALRLALAGKSSRRQK